MLNVLSVLIALLVIDYYSDTAIDTYCYNKLFIL